MITLLDDVLLVGTTRIGAQTILTIILYETPMFDIPIGSFWATKSTWVSMGVSWVAKCFSKYCSIV